MFVTVYMDMRYKYLAVPVARVEYRIPVPNFYLVLIWHPMQKLHSKRSIILVVVVWQWNQQRMEIEKHLNKKTTRVPVLSHQTTRIKTQSAKVMSSIPRVVWWMRTATRVVFYLLWIWKYRIVVNNTFLVPPLTFETTIYNDGLCLEIQNNGCCVRKYHSDVAKHYFN